jgi:hypothetical protein
MKSTLRFTALLLTFSLSTTAFAQSAADLETARTLYTEARNARDAGNFKEALEKFRGAYAVAATPITAIDLAKAEVQAGRLLEAREVLLSVARIKAKPTESDASKQARVEAETLAEQIRVRIPSITIQFTPALAAGAPPPAVTVDGADVPAETFGLARKVNPGEHKVIALSPSAGKVEKTVSVRESETLPVEIDFALATPVPAKAADATGTAKPQPALSATEARDLRPLTYAGFGVAGVGVVLGTISGAVAFGKSSSLSSLCNGTVCKPEAQPIVSSGRSWATVSTVSFIFAGLGAGAGLAGLLLTKSGQTPQAKAGATVGVGFGSVSLEGRF